MQDKRSDRPTSKLPLRLPVLGIFGAVVGGVLGFTAGALVAAANCDWNTQEAGCVEDSVIGAVIGGSLLIPAGFLLLQRHSVPWPPLISGLLVVGAAASVGLALGFATGHPVFIVAVPLVQILAVTFAWRSRPNQKTEA